MAKKIRGAGDLIKKVTSVLGLSQCEACVLRQIELNEKFPFIKEAIVPLEELDILFIKRLKKAHAIGSEDAKYIFDLFNKTFNQDIESCPTCSRVHLELLNKLWVLYVSEYSQDENDVA